MSAFNQEGQTVRTQVNLGMVEVAAVLARRITAARRSKNQKLAFANGVADSVVAAAARIDALEFAAREEELILLAEELGLPISST